MNDRHPAKPRARIAGSGQPGEAGRGKLRRPAQRLGGTARDRHRSGRWHWRLRLHWHFDWLERCQCRERRIQASPIQVRPCQVSQRHVGQRQVSQNRASPTRASRSRVSRTQASRCQVSAARCSQRYRRQICTPTRLPQVRREGLIQTSRFAYHSRRCRCGIHDPVEQERGRGCCPVSRRRGRRRCSYWRCCRFRGCSGLGAYGCFRGLSGVRGESRFARSGRYRCRPVFLRHNSACKNGRTHRRHSRSAPACACRRG